MCLKWVQGSVALTSHGRFQRLTGTRATDPMTAPIRRHRWRIVASALAASAGVALALTGSATGSNISQLEYKLGNTKSQLSSTTQHVLSIAARIGQLNNEVTGLAGQIQLVQAREANMRARLAAYRAKLAAAKVAIGHERRLLGHLRQVLRHARRALARTLVSQPASNPSSHSCR